MSYTYYIDSSMCTEQIQAILDSCKNKKATILFREGKYFFDTGITLTAEHNDLVIEGEGRVRFIGGRCLQNWSKVDETKEVERFDPDVRSKIYVCDLNAEEVPYRGEFVSRGFERDIESVPSEMFFDGRPMNLSQYPKKDDFLLISELGESTIDENGDTIGKLESGFYYDSDRPKSWQSLDNIWVMGYWVYDWANSLERVSHIDTEKQFIRNYPPYGCYGFRVGQRFRFYNIMEEVNQPGDYYIDNEEKKAYIYPEEFRNDSEIIISTLGDPFFDLYGSKNITIKNIIFEACCSHAITAEYTENLLIDCCYFKNIGNYAVTTLEGINNSVLNSTIHDCGDGGVLMFGGDKCTLTPANAAVNNNHIYNIAKWSKCYQPAIYLIGVGMTARHNQIHDCPHTAIMYWGNEMTIADNEIYSVVLETGDAGAIYTGRDFTYRGNRVCHNYIHHLGGVGFGTMGIYNDDCVSGTIMNNNYFQELTRAVFMGGGRNFEVRNNVFVKCDPAVDFDCRGAVWIKSTNTTMKERFYGVEHYPYGNSTTPRIRAEKEKYIDQKVSAMDRIYMERYPELKEVDDFYNSFPEGEVKIPGSAVVENNVFCAKPKFHYHYDPNTQTLYKQGKPVAQSRELWAYIKDHSRDIRFRISGERGDVRLVSNYFAGPDDFVDIKWGVIAVRPDSEAYEFGYTDGDFSSIGLQPELRRVNPPKVLTCIFNQIDEMDALKIGMKNVSNQIVCGILKLFTSDNAVLESDLVSFELEAGEEKEYSVKILRYSGEFEVEVRSTTPGVRPSRNLFMLD